MAALRLYCKKIHYLSTSKIIKQRKEIFRNINRDAFFPLNMWLSEMRLLFCCYPDLICPCSLHINISIWATAHLQYCAKVKQTNFDEFPGFSWLFEEIFLQRNFRKLFKAPTFLWVANSRGKVHSSWKLCAKFWGKICSTYYCKV